MPQQLNMAANGNLATQAYPIPMLVGNGRSIQTGDTSMLIRAARRGDEAAFNNLVAYYQSAAERVAQHILHTEEAAADAVQEAFMKVYKAMKRFKDGNFRSWLMRIVTNTCYDHLRREKRRAALSLDELTEQSKADVAIQTSFYQSQIFAADPERQAICKETMDNLLAAIDKLPPWHQHVVLLIDVHGYDYAEAAEMLCLPLGTIKSRLSRARSALRQELVQMGLGPLPSKMA